MDSELTSNPELVEDYPRRGDSPYVLRMASTAREVEAAQRLRFLVFAEEMGANLRGAHRGLDADAFDEHCDHLLVCVRDTDQVVGTYRILNPTGARNAGGLYSATEFDLRNLAHLANRTVEMGRAAVHPDHRDGAVISLLWAGLLHYVLARGLEYMIGCASVSVTCGWRRAVDILRLVARNHLGPSEYRVFPFRPFPLDADWPEERVALPPLIKGYLRLGAFACGHAGWDPEFGTADLLVMLPLAAMNARYVNGLLRRVPKGFG